MNDWTRTLRGCVTAYGAGVVVISAGNAISAGDFDVIFAVAFFGLIAALPFVLIALLLTAILRARRARISATHGVGITAASFGLWGGIGGMLDGGLGFGLLALSGGVLLGAAFGLVFWIGAYGWTREAHFGAPGEAP